MAKYPSGAGVEWNRDVDNFDVLRRADVLISDFSGVTFDFALVYDKPIIYTDTEFDTAPYDAWWLDQQLWIDTALPRLGMKVTADKLASIKEMIDICLTSQQFANGRQEVREECWDYYGEGAGKTVDYLESKYHELIAVKEEEK